MADLTIVVPVYNEGANFPALWQELTRDVRCAFTALVVYDFDEDNTVPAVQDIIAAGEPRLRLVKNRFGRGVVAAIRSGFAAAPEGPVLVVMADLSDDLAKVDAMLELYRRGYQLVAASRYMKGGRLIGGPVFKQGLSRLAGVSLYWLRGIPTHDATNAFKIYDRAMVTSFNIESQGGFELNLELTVKAFLGGYRIAEIPATWRDRTAGESRFRLWKWLPLYLKWYLYAFRPRRSRPRAGERLQPAASNTPRR
jgi:dolichol-phosphate mannosyltransferase